MSCDYDTTPIQTLQTPSNGVLKSPFLRLKGLENEGYNER